MMNDPVRANHQKTDDKALELGPEVEQLSYQFRLPEWGGNAGHFYVEHEQGDGDAVFAIAKFG